MPKNKRRTIGRVISLVARSLSILLVTILLSGLTFTETNYIPESTSLVIVVDYSDSTEEMEEQITEFATDLIYSADKDTRIATIVFAGDSMATGEFESDHEKALSNLIRADSRDLPKDATNIQDALFQAAQMFDTTDSVDHKRVILLSDGRQTSGNAWEAANVLLNKGIRLDAVSFDITGNKLSEVSMRDFSVSPSQIVDQGKNMTLMVTVESTVDTEGSIRFFCGDDPLVSFTTTIDKGAHIYTRTISADELGGVGLHELRVEVAPNDDSLAQNNTLHTWVKVNDIPSILVVDGDGAQSAKLVQQLEGVYHTEVVRAEQFPTTMEELLPYDEIVLMNVNTNRLPEGADVLIDRFVQYLGRGLLTTTGPTLDSYESYSGTLLEEMLPVTITLDETHNNIAMVIVIDDSGSMLSNGVDKFAPALDGVKICIDALEPTDYVGIVTFHADAEVRQELVKVEDKEALKEKVSSFSTHSGVGGTSYSEGLTTAYAMLRDFDDARSKHVIFLSDGAPTDTNYSKLPVTMKNQGITLSTISLLAGNQAKNIMSKLAEDGDGNYYSIDKDEDLATLTTIMEDLTLKAKEPKFINTEPFVPKVSGQDTGVLSGIEDMTQIVMGGYIGSTLKEDAVMALYNDDFRPIIAERVWGRGRVTTLMTDLGGEWCTELFGNEFGLLLVSNLATQSFHEDVLASSMAITANQQDKQAQVRVETALPLSGQTLTAVVKVKDENGNITELSSGASVSQIGQSIFRVNFTTEDPNMVYYLDLAVLDMDGNVQDQTKFAYTGGIIKEYDLFSESGESLLSSVSKRAGGELMKSVDELYNISMPDADMLVYTGIVPCAIALIVFMLLDIFMRIMNFTRKPKTKHQ